MEQTELEAARMKKLLDEFDSGTFLDDAGDFKYTNPDVKAVIHYDDMNYLGNASKNQLQEHSETINGLDTEDIIELQNIKLVEDEPETFQKDINPARIDSVSSRLQDGGDINYPSLRQQPQNGGSINHPRNYYQQTQYERNTNNHDKQPHDGKGINHPSLRQQFQNEGSNSHPSLPQRPQNEGSNSHPNLRQRPQNEGSNSHPNLRQRPQNEGSNSHPNLQQLPQNEGSNSHPSFLQQPLNEGSTNQPRNRYWQPQGGGYNSHLRNLYQQQNYQARSPGNYKNQDRHPLQKNQTQRSQGLLGNPHQAFQVPYWSPTEPPPFINNNRMFIQPPRPNIGSRYEHPNTRNFPSGQIMTRNFTPQVSVGDYGTSAQRYHTRNVPYK